MVELLRASYKTFASLLQLLRLNKDNLQLSHLNSSILGLFFSPHTHTQSVQDGRNHTVLVQILPLQPLSCSCDHIRASFPRVNLGSSVADD